MDFFFASRRRHTISGLGIPAEPLFRSTGYIDHADFIGIRVNRAKKSGMVNITSSVNSRERSGINTILHRSEERRVGKEGRYQRSAMHVRRMLLRVRCVGMEHGRRQLRV